MEYGVWNMEYGLHLMYVVFYISVPAMVCVLQDVVMMCQEVEKALDRKLQEMPAQVSTVIVLVCYTPDHNQGDNTCDKCCGECSNCQ